MEELRKSGIEAVGDVAWGAHFCQFYQTRDDLTDVLAPYFKAGLENNEFCMWVTSDPLTPSDAREALERVTPSFDGYLQKGQIEIIPHSEWYLEGGSFNLDRVLKGWAGKLNEALSHGFTGMRVTGNTAWLERADWNSFADYEAAINGVIGKLRMIALCTYSLDKCNAADVMDVIRNHEFALMMKDTKWQLIENSAYKEAKLALLASEQKYQSLFNAMTEGFALVEVVLDGGARPCDYRLLEANLAFEKQTGLSLEKVKGKTIREVLPNVEDDWFNTLGKVALTHEPAAFESFSGPLNKWYEVYAYCPSKGKLAIFFRDITTRKQAEERLSYLAGFPEMNPMLVTETDARGNPTYLNPATRKHFPEMETAQAGHPYLKGLVEFVRTQQATGTEQVVRELQIGQRYYQQFAFKVGAKIRVYGLDVTERRRAEEALRESEEKYRSIVETTGEGILIIDLNGKIVFSNGRMSELLGYARDELVGKAGLGFMLGQREAVLAARADLEKGERLQREFTFRRKDGTTLWTSAALSPLLDNHGQHFANLSMYTDITERKKAEEQVRITLESIGDGFFALDADWRYVYVNPAAERILGIRRDDVLGKSHWDVMPLTVGTDLEREYRRAAAGEDRDFENYYEPWGRWFHNRCFPREGGGVSVYCQDITERKRAEEALHVSEEKYRKIVETANEGIVIVSPEGNIDFANDKMAEMLGYTREELQGRQGLELFPPDQHETVLQTREEAMQRDRMQHDYKFLRKGGSVLWTTANVSALFDEEGRRVGTLGIHTDITERRRTEARMQEQLHMLDQAQILVRGLAGKIVFWNRGAERMYSYSKDEAIGQISHTLLKTVFPKPLGEIEAEVLSAGRWQGELVHTRRDGIQIVVASNWVLHRGENGEPAAIIEANNDISELKLAEDALRETTDYLENLFNYANAPIIVWDPQFRVTRFNRAFERLTGLSAAEVLGKQLDILFPDDTRAQSMDHIRKAMAGERWEAVEIPIQRTDGTVRIVLWNSANVHSPQDGTLSATIAQGQDITERKQAEEALIIALGELQQRDRETSALLEASQAVLKYEDFESLARAIFDTCKNLIGATGGYVALLAKDGNENEVLFLDSGGRPCSVDPSLPMPVRGLRAEAYRTGKPVYDNDFAQSQWTGLMPAGHVGLDNVMFAPLVIEGKSAGLVGLANKPGGFNENDARLAESFAGLAAIALQNSRTLESLESSEQTLRETTDYLENLFNYANAPIIVWDPQFRVTRFNRAFERLTGLSAAEVLGKQLDILFPEDTRANSMDHIRKAVAGERWEVVEIPIQRTDGTVRIVLWNSANVYSPEDGSLSATIAQGQDITERKQAENALREREAEVSAILESAPMLMLLIDSDRRVLKCNKAAAEFAGRSVEGMVGLRSGEALRCLHSLDDPRGCGFGISCDTCATRLTVMDTIEKRNSHRQVECRLPFVKEDSTEELTFLLYTFPLSMPQERTLVCIQDVTALKESEEAVRGLNVELTGRASQLEAANKELESFAYSVSHDLRAPLRSMEGFSLALQEDYKDKLDDQGKDYLRRIQGSSQMMAQLIDDILKLSRITRSEMQRETVDLSQMARDIVKEIREHDPKRRSRFRIASGIEASGDAKLLRLVLINLLENAWKFTSKAPQARIEFGVKESDGKKTYFVRDNGVGFDMAYVDKLFRAFQRLHSSNEFPGTGIGLASVQRIIRRHGGEIRAEGETGKGATFSFTLG